MKSYWSSRKLFMRISISIDGNYSKGMDYLLRAKPLFDHYHQELSPSQTAQVAQAIAGGLVFFTHNYEEADHYLQLAADIAVPNKMENFMAIITIIRGFSLLFQRKFELLGQLINTFSPLWNSDQVYRFNKMYLFILATNYLEFQGDFLNFERNLTTIKNQDRLLVKNLFTNEYFWIWQARFALAEGDKYKIRKICEQKLTGLASNNGPASTMYGLLLSYLGEPGKAKTWVRRGLLAQIKTNVKHYWIEARLEAALAFSLIGDIYRVKPLLNWVIQEAQTKHDAFFEARARLLRCLFCCDDNKQRRDDLEKALLLFKKFGKFTYFGFRNFPPELILRCCQMAIDYQIEPSTPKAIARERLGLILLNNGEHIPLLQFKTLGTFKILSGKETLLEGTDLGEIQRKILFLLCITSGKSIRQEEIQTILWPESSPEKSRSSFDTNLFRLRKTFQKALGNISVKNYLRLEKGVLQLDNCHIDWIEFLSIAKEGTSLARNDNQWLAGNKFYQAMQLWQGSLLPNRTGLEAVDVRQRALDIEYKNVVYKLSDILIEQGQSEEAQTLLENFFEITPTEPSTAGRLYRVYSQLQQTIKTRKLIDRFQMELERFGLTDEEIQESINKLLTRPSVY